jgi:bacterioferritin (cytochrome b1)
MVSGLSNAALKAEFMQHAQEEMQHANMRRAYCPVEWQA